MKLPNKQKINRIASHNLSDIDFKDFINIYKKCLSKPYSSLVIDATLASGKSSCFRRNFFERKKN